MSQFIKRFLEISILPNDTQNIIIKFFPLYSSYLFVLYLGNSFIILACIDLFGFASAGLLMAELFTAQFLTDYPTGSLSDYIGQRYVLLLSLIFLSIGYFIISSFQTIELYIIAVLFIGIGFGQFSGSFESYLDTNYKITVGELDQDRKVYGFMYQRIQTIGSLCISLSFIVGGYISTNYSRNSIFALESAFLILLIPFIIFLLQDIKPKIVTRKNSIIGEYLNHFCGGIKFLFSSKKTVFLFLGLAFENAASGIWISLLLIPLYFGYTGSDEGVGTLRALIFAIGSFIAIATSKMNRWISNKNLGFLSLVYNVLFYFLVLSMLTIIPLTNHFNPIGCIVVFLVMIMTVNVLGRLYDTLTQRVLSVIVPSEKRNSIYSLLPSIALILQIPLLSVIGFEVQKFSIINGVIILLIISLIGSVCLLIYQRYETNI